MKKWMYFICEIIFGSIYFLLKLTHILEFIIPKMRAVGMIIINKKITDGVSQRRIGNACSISIDTDLLYKKFQRYDYFTDRIKITKELIDILFDFEDIDKLKGKIFTVETNQIIIKGLKLKLGDRIEIKKIDEFKCHQPFGKLFFISPKVLKENLTNKDLYKTLFKTEKIYKISVEFK